MPAKPWRKRIRIHESTQRELCRILFLFLALIPLVVVTCYSLVRITPGYQSYQKELWQQRISDNLGVDVRFSSIEFPSPERFRAHNFVCLHPETGKQILKVDKINAAMDRSGWTVDLVSPELNGPQIQGAMQVIHDWFLCRPQKSASLLRLSVPEILVFDGAENTKFQNVEVGLQPTETTSTLYLKFSIAGQNFSESSTLVIKRHHALASPTTHLELISNDISIPCRLLAKRFPTLHELGNDASFRGTMAWTQNDQNWDANIAGLFESVDLGIVTAPIGSPIHGIANLLIDQAFIADDRLLLAKGALDLSGTNGNGTAETEWVLRTRDAFGLPAQQSLWKLDNKTARIDRLAVQFELAPNGLKLEGKIRPTDPGWPNNIAMIVDQSAIIGSSTRIPLKTVSDWLLSTSERNKLPRGDESQVSTQNSEMGRYLARHLPWPKHEATALAPFIANDQRK
ncbi:MAG: hypothetical protein ACOVLE_08045 [Pirellula staleyi]